MTDKENKTDIPENVAKAFQEHGKRYPSDLLGFLDGMGAAVKEHLEKAIESGEMSEDELKEAKQVLAEMDDAIGKIDDMKTHNRLLDKGLTSSEPEKSET